MKYDRALAKILRDGFALQQIFIFPGIKSLLFTRTVFTIRDFWLYFGVKPYPSTAVNVHYNVHYKEAQITMTVKSKCSNQHYGCWLCRTSLIISIITSIITSLIISIIITLVVTLILERGRAPPGAGCHSEM